MQGNPAPGGAAFRHADPPGLYRNCEFLPARVGTRARGKRILDSSVPALHRHWLTPAIRQCGSPLWSPDTVDAAVIHSIHW